MGDRRDHFEAEKDPWQIAFRVVEARKRREIDPTLSMLRQCLIDARSEGAEDPQVVERIESMVEFVQASNAWYEEVRRLPQAILVKLLKLGAKVARLNSFPLIGATMSIALWLLAAQGLLGGIDNIWNHEWRAKLPSTPTARRELQLHAARGLIYGPVFLAFAWVELRGLFAIGPG